MKTVKDIMTHDVTCATPSTPLQEVAQLMLDCDCGSIPVVENAGTKRVVGVVTDRDICLRTVAQGRNPLGMTAGEVMSSPVITVLPTMKLSDCYELMEENQVRRVPVVDEQGCCCGIVAQADIALKDRDRHLAEVVQKVSQPSEVALPEPTL